VAARSEAWTVFARLNTGIVGSNPTQSRGVCVRLFYVYVEALQRADPPVQGVLPTVQKDQETEKATKVQQRAVEPYINR
jgi:hypothetical protein